MNANELKRYFPQATGVVIRRSVTPDYPETTKGSETARRVREEVQKLPAAARERLARQSAAITAALAPLVRDFRINVQPMGAPRMTQQDKWKKRPVIQQYWAYHDAIRKAVGAVEVPDEVHCEFFIAMPPSWPKSKKWRMAGTAHRQKPDGDNLVKGVLDALFENDAGVWRHSAIKRWEWPGYGRIMLTLRWD